MEAELLPSLQYTSPPEAVLKVQQAYSGASAYDSAHMHGQRCLASAMNMCYATVTTLVGVCMSHVQMLQHCARTATS